jgi:hypothetical protein
MQRRNNLGLQKGMRASIGTELDEHWLSLWLLGFNYQDFPLLSCSQLCSLFSAFSFLPSFLQTPHRQKFSNFYLSLQYKAKFVLAVLKVQILSLATLRPKKENVETTFSPNPKPLW